MVCSSRQVTFVRVLMTACSGQPRPRDWARDADYALRCEQGAFLCDLCWTAADERLQIDEHLPGHIDAVKKAGHPAIWVCDPMHGK
jgi:hypothetical protein